MGRAKKLRIQNYRSVKERVEICFPEDCPLVLVGENNSGKSNIVHGLELLLGEGWPGNYQLEDHDFHNRDKANIPVELEVELQDVWHEDTRKGASEVSHLTWSYPQADGKLFRMVVDDDFVPFVSNAVREQCLCIVVSADRRLSYQLSYTSKSTFLSKLMHKFHQALTADALRVNDLKGRFEEIKALFQGVAPFDAFTSELQKQVEELSSNLEYRLGVDFSAYDPSNYFHALRVLPHQDGNPRTFDELGTGQEQILALSFAYAYAKAFHGEAGGLIVVIEEPEAHLHPLAQEWVGQKIHDLAKEGVQVVVTTHSSAFLNILNLEGLALLRKDREATKVIQLSKESLAQYCTEHGATKATNESILPFYAAAATEEILSGFFARKIVLVEGPTEALALPIYLDKVGLQVTRDGIAIIPVHGVGNLAKWWRLFTAYQIPVYVIFDNDSSEDTEDTIGIRRIPSGSEGRTFFKPFPPLLMTSMPY